MKANDIEKPRPFSFQEREKRERRSNILNIRTTTLFTPPYCSLALLPNKFFCRATLSRASNDERAPVIRLIRFKAKTGRSFDRVMLRANAKMNAFEEDL